MTIDKVMGYHNVLIVSYLYKKREKSDCYCLKITRYVIPYINLLVKIMKKLLGIDSGLAILLDKAPSEELDYGFVMECLKGYTNPRIKLNHLLRDQGFSSHQKRNLYFWDTGLRDATLLQRKHWPT